MHRAILIEKVLASSRRSRDQVAMLYKDITLQLRYPLSFSDSFRRTEHYKNICTKSCICVPVHEVQNIKLDVDLITSQLVQKAQPFFLFLFGPRKVNFYKAM